MSLFNFEYLLFQKKIFGGCLCVFFFPQFKIVIYVGNRGRKKKTVPHNGTQVTLVGNKITIF